MHVQMAMGDRVTLTDLENYKDRIHVCNIHTSLHKYKDIYS